MKVLFIATVDIHILSFHIPYLRYFKEQGYEVHVACAVASNCVKQDIPFCDVRHSIPFERSPFSISNIKAYKKLRDVIKGGHFDLIHCHTPVGSVLGRLAAFRSGAKVLYTCHGFQFYKGAPISNWLIYYPVEWLMSLLTDVLITINTEDYNTSRRFPVKKNVRVNGVGVESEEFRKTAQKVKKISNDFVIVCVGELNKNKNQQFILEAFPAIISKIPNLKLRLVGQDSLNGFHKNLAEALNICEHVEFLGYRTDIPDIIAAADIAVSASIREGLGINVIEAMVLGKATVVSSNRGHDELVKDGINGYIFKQGDKNTFISRIITLYENETLRNEMGEQALEMSKQYDIKVALSQMKKVYKYALKKG